MAARRGKRKRSVKRGRAASSRASRAKTSPSDAAKAASDSRKIDKLLADANGTSAAANHAWLAFLALIAYLLVTLSGVTHKELLLNDPVTLPVVNVQIPMFSFFQWAPALLLLVYLSLLVQHVILARKYREFTGAIAPYEKSGREHPDRELVHSYAVSQILAGPRRNSVTTCLMRLMVFVTFAVLPIVTLLYFQIKFIPYHDVAITYWHRIAVVLGLAMLFIARPIMHVRESESLRAKPKARRPAPSRRTVRRPSLMQRGERLFADLKRISAESAPIRRVAVSVAAGLLILGLWLLFFKTELLFAEPSNGHERLQRIAEFVFFLMLLGILAAAYVQSRTPEIRLGPKAEPWRASPAAIAVGAVFAAVILGFGWLVVTVPDETIDRRLADWVPAAAPSIGEEEELLLNPIVRFVYNGIPEAPGSNDGKRGLRWLLKQRVLIVEDEDIVRDADDLHGEVSVLLRGRNLRYARLSRSDLHRGDLTRADLAGAELKGTRLRKATLDEAMLQGADLYGAQLQGAHLIKAKLQGADLRRTELYGAKLNDAELQRAKLSEAQLQGADLSRAKLFGAILYGAQLQGANLTDAKLQGANLLQANFRGADLAGAGISRGDFPGCLEEDASAPIGIGTPIASPLTPDIAARINKDLRRTVGNKWLLTKLTNDVDKNLDVGGGGGQSDCEYSGGRNEFSPEELAAYLAHLACGERVIAKQLSERAVHYGSARGRKRYAGPLARTLLDKDCKGVKALTPGAEARLHRFLSAIPEESGQSGTQQGAAAQAADEDNGNAGSQP